MKKHLLFISTMLVGFSSYAQYEGFENWTNNSVETLDDYETMVNENAIVGSTTTYKSTDAFTGTYSIRLETVQIPSGDTIFGFFMSGDFENQIPGQAVTLFPSGVDSIIGYYKYDIQAGDSAVFSCTTFIAGTTTGGGIWYIKGTQNTWKRFAYPINAILSDSLLLASATGDPVNDFNGIPGSWIQFDDIQIKGLGGTQNLENYSFENWSPINWEEPNGWVTTASYSIGEPILAVEKTTDQYAGSFAAKLTTVENQQGDTIGGLVTNGDFGSNGFTGGAPYTANPIGVEVYYKNTLSGTDTSWLSIEFKTTSGSLGQYGAQLTPAASYTLFSQAISLPSTPDTVLLGAFSGDNPGSQLFIDNIDFVFPVGISENLRVEKLVAYPNPATDVLKIKFNIQNNNDVTIRLVDALGKELTNRSLGHLSSGTYRESFNTSSFSKGVYFIEFTLDNEKVVERFIVK
ncbi:MAG: hypothetical protein COB15_00685 [Flavobacteriales bacterium]|nr:MAG: hypothetical protein COB15_00685 [Flavobacteriales bacterium]